ncbi:gliding motility-associated C-terminal domain-containing protein [Hymenobacter humi]|uniref:Gliding motility-associated C-terminal domain-containing protein n=1 Tax=Hymenobacter humi TaxID=1411620 RepID=A0ABW2UCX7_9BACT
MALYVATVNLPMSNSGYNAYCNNSNRVAGITNFKKSVDEGMFLGIEIAPASVPNASPVFSTVPVTLICAGTNSLCPTTRTTPTATSLVYEVSRPGGLYGNLIDYAAGYTPAQPFGAGGKFEVNASTGISNYLSPSQGVFQVAVNVQEYRTINGQRILLSTARRDMQVVVRTCSGVPGQAPAFTAASLAQPRDFTIREGQTVQFDVAATDPDGDPLTLTARSALLDGSGGIDASFGGQPGTSVGANPVGQASIRGTGTVAGTFRLTGCGADRRAPYEVLVTATDEACNTQTVVATFRITVTRPVFSGVVQGTGTVCAQSVATYTVSGGAASGSLQWSVLGGQVLGPATGPTVQVLWGTGTTGTVRVNGTTDLGCPTQAVSYPVSIRPGLPITGPIGYCLTAATGLRFTANGQSSSYQWTITNGTIVSGQGSREVVVNITPGTTATLQVAQPGAGSCVTTLLVGPDDSCLYFYNVITPNGDNKNDAFVVRNIERHPNTALTVFNRWGQKLYHSDDYQNSYGREITAAGLYYYLCRTADGATYKGWFEVIK